MGVRLPTVWILAGAAACLAAGCGEDLVAPADGVCPDFCPPERLEVVDSVLLDNVLSDSTFTGYVLPHRARSLQVYRDSSATGDATSRAVVVFPAFRDSLLLGAGGTAMGAVLGTDSFSVVLPLRGRNPGVTGLEAELHRIPASIDSTTAYADLDPWFTDSTLLATVAIPDSVVSDRIRVVLDSLAFPGLAASGNQVALGVTLRSPSGYLQLGAVDNNDGVELTRYVRVDSAGTPVPRIDGWEPSFDSFVFPPPPPAGPAEREIGGTPASRTFLRFSLPQRMARPAAVIRATLVLVPTAPVIGPPGDSMVVLTQGLAADAGAKSPLQGIPADSVPFRVAYLPVGSTDTVRLDVTDLVIGWVRDTTRPRVLVVRAEPEGNSVVTLRVGAADAAARPRLHVTFVPPLALGGR